MVQSVNNGGNIGVWDWLTSQIENAFGSTAEAAPVARNTATDKALTPRDAHLALASIVPTNTWDPNLAIAAFAGLLAIAATVASKGKISASQIPSSRRGPITPQLGYILRTLNRVPTNLEQVHVHIAHLEKATAAYGTGTSNPVLDRVQAQLSIFEAVVKNSDLSDTYHSVPLKTLLCEIDRILEKNSFLSTSIGKSIQNQKPSLEKRLVELQEADHSLLKKLRQTLTVPTHISTDKELASLSKKWEKAAKSYELIGYTQVATYFRLLHTQLTQNTNLILSKYISHPPQETVLCS